MSSRTSLFNLLSADRTDDGYLNTTLVADLPLIPPFCLFVFEPGTNGEYNMSSPNNFWGHFFEIIPAATTVSVVLGPTSSGSTSSSTNTDNPQSIAASASASVAAPASVHAEHDRAIGLGVGLGLALPIVMTVSVGLTLLLSKRTDPVHPNTSSNDEDVIYQGVGTEQLPAAAGGDGNVSESDANTRLAARSQG